MIESRILVNGFSYGAGVEAGICLGRDQFWAAMVWIAVMFALGWWSLDGLKRLDE